MTRHSGTLLSVVAVLCALVAAGKLAKADSLAPGAEYVGAASDADGLRALRERVARLPRDTAIVNYCGCCPWTRCPNMGAAHEALRALGFAQLKALHIANDFGRDWVDKGYPVARNR